MDLELPFMKKKSPGVIQGKGMVPVDRVRELASRGFSEPEMIDVLRRDGFSPEEIDKALTQALQIGVSGEQHQTASAPQPTPYQAPQMSAAPQLPQLPQKEQQPDINELMPQIPETSLPEDYSAQYPTEDYIDYIVQARVSEFSDKIGDMEKKINELDGKINSVNEKIVQISQGKSESHEVANRIENFNDTVNDIGSRVGSLERAFKETLPALIESVRGLGDVVQKMKKEG